jgi:hypothetical protein
MSRMKLALDIVSDLKALAKSIEILVKAMETDEMPSVEESALKEEKITIEQVRAVLAEKSQDGKQPEVKALIQKYGANKLTEVDPSNYKNLLKEAEVI